MPQGLPSPTIAHPLPSGKQVTLSEAAAVIGEPVVIPDTALTSAEEAGPVWAWSHDTRGIVAVTYPSVGLIISYQRPLTYADPLAGYTGVSKGIPSSHVISLGGVPALAVPENTDETGHNFGVVAFEIKDLEIRVMGHYDEATLEAVAQSIVDGSK